MCVELCEEGVVLVSFGVFWHFLCGVLSGQAKQSASFRPNPPLPPELFLYSDKPNLQMGVLWGSNLDMFFFFCD